MYVYTALFSVVCYCHMQIVIYIAVDFELSIIPFVIASFSKSLFFPLINHGDNSHLQKEQWSRIL